MSSNAAAKNPVVISQAKKAEMNRLTNPPKFAWPTLAVLTFIVGGVTASNIAALNLVIPLWAACLLNVAFMYPSFHVAHDATHRAASSNVTLNDWIGRLGLLFVIPHVSLETIRYTHMVHHRFTNLPKDPDFYTDGPWWSLPFRWLTFDASYLYYNLSSGDKRGIQSVKDSIPIICGLIAVIAACVATGYGTELVMLWLIPSRLVVGLWGIVFLWLPHLDENKEGKLVHITDAYSKGDLLTSGTTMRIGREGLLDLVLQWHNYHLIHHLWPTTPSYNHRAVWRLMEPELRARDMRIQHGFALRPKLDLAPTLASAN